MYLRILDGITTFAMTLAEICVFLMTIHVTLDVLSRWVIGDPLIATTEIVRFYYMVAIIYFPLAWVTRMDGHIAAQIFTQYMTDKNRQRLEGVIHILLFLFMAVLTWQTGTEAYRMMVINEVHQAADAFFKIWPARWYLPLGSGLMSIYALTMALQKLFGPIVETKGDDVTAMQISVD
jgi:TRAP-type C4-dicarboxylate transport system permease small subunit